MEIDSKSSASATPPRAELMRARDKRLVLYVLSLVMDVCAIGLPAVMFSQTDRPDLYRTSAVVVMILTPIYIMLAIAREVQSVDTLRSRSLGIKRALEALVGALLLTALTVIFLKIPDLSRLAFGVTIGLSAILLLSSEVLFSSIARIALGTRPTRDLLLLDGARVDAPAGMDLLDIGAMGLTLDLARPDVIDALSRIVAPFDRVVVACSEQLRPVWATFLKGSDVGGEILVQSNILEGAVAIGRCDLHDTLIISRGPLSASNRAKKRLFDIVVALSALVFLAPLLLLTAIAIKLDSRGPVFFRQQRVGLGNRLFWILKFRSMRTDMADAQGQQSASRVDPRITRVGRFIRRTSIDELPQLINVLLGDMSMVGPRPHALGSLAGDELFWEVSDSYWIRHSLKPGITGLAQVRGYRGATDSREELKRRIRCDLEYLSGWSLAGDLAILMRTFTVIIHDKAY